MSDGFFPFPGGNWTTPTTTGGATFSDPYTGIYYYLDIHAPTPRPTAASFLTRSTAAFNSHQVTIAIDIQTTAQSSLVDVGSVAIENSVIPHAILAEADLDASTLMLTFKIGGTSFTPVALAAGTYYRLTFNVNASDMATWTLGAGTPTTAMAFSPVMVDVALKGNWAMGTPLANPDFLFRNALVTSP
jgi:hypothetical protein